MVLSGTGSDGVLGVKAIQEAGGLVLAQEPETAGFGATPDIAIATGIVDQVLSPEKIPEALARFAGHDYICRELIQNGPNQGSSGNTGEPPTEIDRNSAIPKSTDDGLDEIVKLLGREVNCDFRHYKRATLSAWPNPSEKDSTWSSGKLLIWSLLICHWKMATGWI